MQPVTLFDLAAQQARWLSVSQSTVAGNIANANTPGFRAMEVEPFESVLSKSRVSMAATNAGHFNAGAAKASFSTSEIEPKNAVMPSDNTVSLEDELIKSGEVRRSFELNAAIVKSFHRLLMMTARS